jgi:hypothetical protein
LILMAALLLRDVRSVCGGNRLRRAGPVLWRDEPASDQNVMEAQE